MAVATSCCCCCCCHDLSHWSFPPNLAFWLTIIYDPVLHWTFRSAFFADTGVHPPGRRMPGFWFLSERLIQNHTWARIFQIQLSLSSIFKRPNRGHLSRRALPISFTHPIERFTAITKYSHSDHVKRNLTSIHYSFHLSVSNKYLLFLYVFLTVAEICSVCTRLLREVLKTNKVWA